MSKETDILKDQLRRACKLSGARWAAVLVGGESGWQCARSYGLQRNGKKALESFMQGAGGTRWLDGGLSSTRTRTKASGKMAADLGVERLFLFSRGEGSELLLVGAEALETQTKGFLEMLTMSLLAEERIPLATLNDNVVIDPIGLGGEISFDLRSALTQILEALCAYVPAEVACLAVRAGDMFGIKATKGFELRGQNPSISLDRHAVLARMVKQGEGVLAAEEEGAPFPLEEIAGTSKPHWLGIPLVVGRRVIGAAIFGRERGYSEGDLKQATVLGKHVSPAVEKTMMFVEAAGYLQRFALLNELATVASAEIDLDELIRRIKRMLGRTFPDAEVRLLLLSADGSRLRDYVAEAELRSTPVFPLDSTLEGKAIELGKPVRLRDRLEVGQYRTVDPGVQSKLAVPLKFHGQKIGVLTLESTEEEAFSPQDELFLTVIASQIAGMVENTRLNDETRQRAHNLALINEIVEQVVGLTDLTEISRLAAKLMAERFGHELVLILLADEVREELLVEGPGAALLGERQEEIDRARYLGAVREVLDEGESRLVADINMKGEYAAIPAWASGSEMVVALREGEKVVGLIHVLTKRRYAFTARDLLALEALAGVLASVMTSAKRYQELQVNVRQLRAVRETALDISTDLDLDVLLKRVVNRVRELVDALGAELALIDEEEQVVRILVSDNPWQDYTGYTFPLMGGVAGRVAAEGEPLVVDDYNAWVGKGEDDFKAPFTTVAGVPLMLGGEIIGTLTVQDDRSEKVFKSEDIQILQLLAPQVTIFIRNAMLFEELEERIEAQRLAEERLVRSARLAAVGEMAAGIAHELNNPLTTVTGFAELVLDELPEDFQARQDMDLVLKEARRARDVVRRLLDFSRQDEILRTWVDINEIISNVLALVHHLARTSGVDIRVQLWDDLPRIRVDRNQMQQVLLNLVHNALQAMPEGGNLAVGTAVEKREGMGWITIEVRDEGVGIEEENLGHIFEPFFTTKPLGSGTGLGLSVSYGIVSEHGGFIEVESAKGEGSSFTVWLPIETESEQVSA